MKSFFFALLLLPARVSADPCTAKSAGPCTPSDDQKAAIMTAIKAGILAQGNMESTKYSAKQALEAGHPEEALKASQAELDYLHEMQSSFNESIRLTELYYHLTPPTPSGTVASPKGPGEFLK